MTNDTQARHPFLDDLTPHAELRSAALREPVFGRDNIKRWVKAAGSLYKSQTLTFFEWVGTRGLLQYEAELANGLIVHGTAVIDRNPDGSVPRLSVTFGPLGSALSLAGRLSALLDKNLGAGLLL
jgi:hypothetical protein